MGYEAPFAPADAPNFREVEHLLVWAWRRIAADRDSCPLIMARFAHSYGEDGPELFLTLCAFVDAFTFASRRPFVFGVPGCTAITSDERQTLALLAAVQAGRDAMHESGPIACFLQRCRLIEPASGAPFRSAGSATVVAALAVPPDHPLESS